jgi:tRNA 2-selenouridine synthase
MALHFASLPEFYNHGYDTVIDVRSPDEFKEDRIPGAISLPVLDNEERARVGTIYKQQSPFLARKLGAALVFKNAATHVEGPLQHHDGGWKPLVYCWRGGQRSGSFTWMLQQIGWRADVIEGGYRTYRRLVVDYLYDTPLPHQLILLDGYTGTAKTDVLELLQQRGIQILDLEKLANHRGSLLGTMGEQPSQKAFESDLAAALCQLDPGRPVVVEAESNKIGERLIPPALWTRMKSAPRIEITASIEARTDYLVKAYHDILSDTAGMRRKLSPLRAYRGGAVTDGWEQMIDDGDKAGLTRALMEQHYDLAYAKSRNVQDHDLLGTVHATDLSDDGLEHAAKKIITLINQSG